jgi:hypothetical protein
MMAVMILVGVREEEEGGTTASRNRGSTQKRLPEASLRKFTFRGIELDALFDLTNVELMDLVWARARPRMSFVVSNASSWHSGEERCSS